MSRAGLYKKNLYLHEKENLLYKETIKKLQSNFKREYIGWKQCATYRSVMSVRHMFIKMLGIESIHSKEAINHSALFKASDNFRIIMNKLRQKKGKTSVSSVFWIECCYSKFLHSVHKDAINHTP